ncbi:nuclear transport factor 2 family protein [Pseudoalteromonas sp. SMS1]|uniref:nuclear transport factor 2 family protein n=1 Tax=Pseudoalteromonas sp. SMS1 TaxID=2908894 RepID=UPI001F409A19|nr:nuclear transport factor 2 family protein [Pseudoalteromonas sp. SMS1]MCF2860283.1 nuclear transport factor 2 family protein [Pseudoalteromonas sp. SMS1]
MRIILILFITIISFNCFASTPEKVVSELWQALSHDKNRSPDIRKLSQLLHPEAKVFGLHFNSDKKHNLMVKSGEEFIKLLDRISGKGFYECEVVRKVTVYDHFAHVYSVVETRFEQAKVEPEFTGVNSIQLVKVEGVWQILSLYYQVENPKKVIPLNGGSSGRCL